MFGLRGGVLEFAATDPIAIADRHGVPFGDLAPTVRDHTGLVTRAEQARIDPSLRFRVIDVAVVNPPGTFGAVDVVWVMTPCQRRPVIDVQRAGDNLAITVFRGPSEPEDCEAMGLVRAVRLTLLQSWSADDVRARVVDGEPSAPGQPVR